MGNDMRKLFFTAAAAVVALLVLSMAAKAADVGVRAPAYTPPPPVYAPAPFSWTRFYVGGNIGGAWGRGEVTDSLFSA
jgi:outer membrane immunogenic protein